ncbi:MAG: S8 family serine peptidase [Actinomycetota bacterium]
MKPRWIGSVSLALALSAAALPGAAGGREGTKAGWWVVRFDGTVIQPDRDLLTDAGARGIQYQPRDSYVAHMSSAAAETLAGRRGVSGVRLLGIGDKVDPALSGGEQPQPLTVSVFGSSRSSIMERLAQHGRVSAGFPASIDGAIHDLFVLAPPAAARTIAAEPNVLYVGPASPGLAPLDERSDQIQAGNINGTTVAPGYEAWLQSTGLDGAGVTVSVVDSGVDPHPDFGNRIVARVDYAPAGQSLPVDEPLDTLGHGTHVAGIVGGDANGTSAVTRIRDSEGFLYGLGVAPKVRLVSQNALSTLASAVLCGALWPPPYEWGQLTRDALSNGASVWNASWWSCEDGVGNYIETSRVFDGLARDADSTAPGSQPFTFVFSAGNSGPASQTVAAPASAKNTISVGATQNARGGNPNNMASFSSRGPAADGRILPTISAPGDSIISTRSFAGALCNVPPADSFGLYASCSGTSMAAPHVTGAVALLTQWWNRTNPSPPSPAMTKALLVNTATDMGPSNVPNKDEGWGRVNIGTLFDPAAQRVYSDQAVVLSDPGSSAGYQVAPADPSKPLKVTLVWTDAPAQAGAEIALVNDLDLVVSASDGTGFLGNSFSEGRSVIGGVADNVNNVESVYINNPAGTYSIGVSATNLPGDGVPGSGDETDQDFALVISNATLVG